MAIFPGAGGDDILSCRSVAELLADVRRRLDERLSYLTTGDDVVLVDSLRGRIEEELAGEERFAVAFDGVISAISGSAGEEDLAPFRRRGEALVADHFRHRGSVLVSLRCGTAMQDHLVRRVLGFTEEWMAASGYGAPPAPYCWFASGSAGREEAGCCGEHDALLVFGTAGDGNDDYFVTFGERAAAVLEHLGMRSTAGISPALPAWRGSIGAWRQRLSDELAVVGGGEEFPSFVQLADLRRVHGPAELAEEMTVLVESFLDFHRSGFRQEARSVSAMAAGLDFFGRFRVERRGSHRGEFDIDRYALLPLLANVRLLALAAGVRATSTVSRIKGLQEKGLLDVDLAHRLLLAFHDLMSSRLGGEIARGGWGGTEGCFLRIEGISPREEEGLKGSLEAVIQLQRIVHQNFAESR